MSDVILTGIKPTGEPHLGNYLGAIQPAMAMAKQFSSTPTYFFIADYHALTTLKDPTLMLQYRRVIAATWLAFFHNQSQCRFYFQSHIPQVFELYWILSCMCPKGLLNRAHAYKALVAQNTEQGHDPDRQINQGVFSYPVLMAADILLFRATKVPIGPDQKQHVEIAIELVKALNHHLSNPIPLPEPLIDPKGQLIIGIDGRKMSKNYNNTIPLFGTESEIKKRISKIQTDSKPLGEALDPDTCHVFQFLSYVVSKERLDAIRSEYLSGAIGYGHAKAYLLDAYMHHFNNVSKRYTDYMQEPDQIDQAMATHTQQVQAIAAEQLANIKRDLGF